MDVKARNKRVKKILSAEFGNKNVSVRNGRGTAYGWCEIYIDLGKRLSGDIYTYSKEEREKINNTCDKANELIKNEQFYTYYDDMNTRSTEVIIQATFSH